MKITKMTIAGKPITVKQCKALIADFKTEMDAVGFRTDFRISDKGGVLHILIGCGIDLENPPLTPPMARLDVSKHGRSFIDTAKDGILSYQLRLTWNHKIKFNHILNGVLDNHGVSAEIKTDFQQIRKEEGSDVITQFASDMVMYIRSVDKGATKIFGKEPGFQSFSNNEVFEQYESEEVLPVKKFRTAEGNAIAAAVEKGTFKPKKDLNNKLVIRLIDEDKGLIKFLINRLGGKFLEPWGAIVEVMEVDLAVFACKTNPKNANYFNQLSVQKSALEFHGLAAIKFIKNPDKVLLAYVEQQWPGYAEILADLDAIRKANENKPSAAVVKVKK